MEDEGMRTNLRAVLTDKLRAKGWELDIIDLAEARLTNCIGCFECWVKTPGQCRFGDFGRELAGGVIHSDLLLIVSRIRFGSHSSDVQRAFERMLPLLSPLFEKVKGETHHVHRYDRYPSLAALGVLHGADEKSEEIFRKRVERISINLFSPSCPVAIVGSQGTSG
jgi:multimeric flavodoxin WrbA